MFICKYTDKTERMSRSLFSCLHVHFMPSNILLTKIIAGTKGRLFKSRYFQLGYQTYTIHTGHDSSLLDLQTKQVIFSIFNCEMYKILFKVRFEWATDIGIWEIYLIFLIREMIVKLLLFSFPLVEIIMRFPSGGSGAEERRLAN